MKNKGNLILTLISLLVFLLFLSISIKGLSSFYAYKNAVSPKIELTLDRFHFFVKNELITVFLKLITPKHLPDSKSPLTTFRITVEQEDLDFLNSDLPSSGKNSFINAYLKISDRGEEIYKVKMRYRGDSNYHWLYKQKSLRIKFSNNDSYLMAKTFNLINPVDEFSYRNSIEYNLSRDLGLISPEYIPCRVFINGEYMGVYVFLSQVDESLLRSHKVMPGSIYYGDGSPIDENGIADLWNDEKYWAKKASRNAEQKENRDDIDLFIKYVNSDVDDFNYFVETFLDKEKFFTFIAMDRVFGSNHHDYLHNHKIYFDPYKGKFEPISWDLRFWLPLKEKDLSLYPLQLKLASNPVYDAEIDRIAYNIMQNNLLELVDKSYDDILLNIEQDLRHDIYKDRAYTYKNISDIPVSEVLETERVLESKDKSIGVIKTRISYLEKLYNDTKIYYNNYDLNNERFLEILIDGTSPVIISFPDNLNQIYINNSKDILRSSTVLYPGRQILNNSQVFFDKALYGTKTVTKIPCKYILKVPEDTTIENIVNNLSFTNYITDKKIIAKSTGNMPVKYISGEISYETKSVKTLKGLEYVKESLIFDRNTTVYIEPGTTFYLEEGASIYFYGKVIARGTKDNPIRFTSKEIDKSWGLVAVQGKRTTGSIFEYCEFEGGSVDSHNLINYTAPFNIHDTDWFEVRNCKIGENFIGDDAMHIAYANGIVDSTVFDGARSDGLDVDIANVKITNSIFMNSGNDGLDIMTSEATIYNNVFLNTGDKGISVGEWSTAEIKNNIFVNNLIGLEVKDKSVVKADNLLIADAIEKPINLYNKNSRYDEGGHLKADSITIIGNDLITYDKRSSLDIKIKNIVETYDFKSIQWFDNLKENNNYLNDIEVKYD